MTKVPVFITRIVYVIGQLTFGGTENQLLELIRNLNPTKFKVMVVCLSTQAPLANSFIRTGCEVYTLNREKRPRLLVLWDLYRIFRLFNPDIVHSYAYASRAAIPISKFFLKSKIIVSIRTQPDRQVVWRDRFLNSFADYILTNSKKAAESIHFGFHEIIPCQVIHNGIDLQKFDTEAGFEFNSGLPLNSSIKVICAVSRLHPIKGLDILLDAFATVLKELNNTQLWIVGSGPDSDKLKIQVDKLNLGSHVVFWGQQENIAAILRNADVGILSSHVEGLPNAIIEYLAAGLPIVATNVGGVSELIIHNTNGLLVEPNNPTELAKAILILLKDTELAKKFGKNGRIFVEKHFELKKMILETEAVYNKLLSSRRS